MLARSPIAQVWKDDAPHFSRLVENGVTIAVIDRSYGRWDGRLDQSLIRHNSKTTRSTVGGLSGYTSREACKIAVEDRIDAARNPDQARLSSDAVTAARDAMGRPVHEMDDNPAALTVFDVLGNRWIA